MRYNDNHVSTDQQVIGVHSTDSNLDRCSALLRIPSKHQGRVATFAISDRYSKHGEAPILVALATVISRYRSRTVTPTIKAEIGDMVAWTNADGETTTWTIVDDRPLRNPYLVATDTDN